MKLTNKNELKHDLCLRLMQQYGVVLHQDKTVVFDEDGQLNAIRFDDALSADYTWLADVQCTVHWDSVGSSWQLRHGHDTYNCTVNDVLLASGDAILLHAGDQIEIGLLRLEVLATHFRLIEVQKTPTIEIVPASTEDNSLVGVEDNPAFALTDLAGEEYWQRLIEKRTNPFDIVPPIVGGFPVENNSLHDTPKPAVVTALKQQYILAIVDPAALQAKQLTEMPAFNNKVPADNLTQLVEKAKHHRSAEDIVSGPMEMRHIYGLYGVDVTDRFKTDVRETHILQQFAGDLARTNNRPRIPELTRREHHAVSPDSHFSLGRAFPDSDTNDK